MKKTLAVFAFWALLAACALAAGTKNEKAGAASGSTNSDDAILVGAGDVANCGAELEHAEATAKLLDGIEGTVFVAGDLAYPDGTDEQFANCYGQTWGRQKSRTKPATGNHEYHSDGASGYFRYFGDGVGDPKKGYYSYEVGKWHAIVLNSNCEELQKAGDGCSADSAQVKWLKQDLAAHPAACTVAYWHAPLFSSGAKHGNYPAMHDIWQALYDGGADLVLNGHDHDYERFAPQTPDGKADPKHGIREFVVGTGGKELRPFGLPKPNSQVRNADTFGVLKLTLHPDSYEWEFLPVVGKTFTDSGKGSCH